MRSWRGPSAWRLPYLRGGDAGISRTGFRGRLFGLPREVLLGGDEPGIPEPQRGHEGGMDLGRRDDRPLELLVAGGAGVVDDDAPVAEVAGGAGARVHAHVAHRPADHHLLDAVTVKDRLEVGLAERVDVVLQHDRLALAPLHL